MSDYHFERTARIRFAHCDPASIIYFPQYLVLFSDLVEDWFTDGLGVSYAQILGPRRIGLPIVKLHCEFSVIGRMGDDVQFKLELERLDNASLTLGLGCWSGSELRVRSRQVLVFTDLNTRRAMPMPPGMRQTVRANVQQSRQKQKESHRGGTLPAQLAAPQGLCQRCIRARAHGVHGRHDRLGCAGYVPHGRPGRPSASGTAEHRRGVGRRRRQTRVHRTHDVIRDQ